MCLFAHVWVTIKFFNAHKLATKWFRWKFSRFFSVVVFHSFISCIGSIKHSYLLSPNIISCLLPKFCMLHSYVFIHLRSDVKFSAQFFSTLRRTKRTKTKPFSGNYAQFSNPSTQGTHTHTHTKCECQRLRVIPYSLALWLLSILMLIKIINRDAKWNKFRTCLLIGCCVRLIGCKYSPNQFLA